MSKEVKGFLAADGTFFDREAECDRYEAMKELEKLCDTHETNFENFLVLLNSWHGPIERYYDADNKCEAHQVGRVQEPEPEPDPVERMATLLPTKRDRPNSPRRERYIKSILEQSIRGDI
jgi:hypothetical protein